MSETRTVEGLEELLRRFVHGWYYTVNNPLAAPSPSLPVITILEQALAALRASQGPGWQSIESAPKDGRDILLAGGGTGSGQWRRVGYWARRVEVWSIDCVVPLSEPTHWMPLPPVPSLESGEGR